ncbi:hypothetical protein BRC86_13855 [Halobacteriales archaeon QS_3_64_16]|nr:MAG: hypothetical protein BRC86_13855 [Halobacteriales archaeon QS_3_64_16]
MLKVAVQKHRLDEYVWVSQDGNLSLSVPFVADDTVCDEYVQVLFYDANVAIEPSGHVAHGFDFLGLRREEIEDFEALFGEYLRDVLRTELQRVVVSRLRRSYLELHQFAYVVVAPRLRLGFWRFGSHVVHLLPERLKLCRRTHCSSGNRKPRAEVSG